MLNLTGQTVAILGAGRSGQAAAALALHCGASVTVYDAGEISKVPAGCDQVSGATIETGRAVNVDIVVTSPGIETGGEFVQAFAEGSGALWGEIELAWRCFPGRTIAITGTNGKTTTTELVRELVKATGRTCVACGNYGVPLAEVVLADEVPEVIALELSSFQLETIDAFKPDAVIWLNFSADHMDRYSSLEEYQVTKLRIFRNCRETTPLVIRAGENLGELNGQQITFSSQEDADWTLQGEVLYQGRNPFIDLSQTRLRGVHNAENLMAACAVVDGLTPELAVSALKEYRPPAHRCELVGILDGVEYLNDSKATNLHALESALRSQTRPTVLLAGGKEKGLDYQSLAPLLAEKVIHLISFGQIGPALAQTFSDLLPCQSVATLREAVKAAQQVAPRGSTILLSPGTSSFDQFRGYEERGEAFRSLVLSLN
ncbi:UDP-N-acetylmuramoyl-L-alanine--D-glutamate ligase [Akkermansiaceae bacterium]|nr:UDP-N-acetylmuramoyl-L-alanine--D-glutamate ligase [Akkermansiaceae bacterium]